MIDSNRELFFFCKINKIEFEIFLLRAYDMGEKRVQNHVIMTDLKKTRVQQIRGLVWEAFMHIRRQIV